MIVYPNLLTRLSSNDPTLTSLIFIGDKLTFDDCIRLANALSSNTHLEKLWLNDNKIGDDSLSPILQTLLMGKNNRGHPSLRQLYITKNNIGDDSAELLAELICVVNLDELWLNGNHIGDVGAEYLSRALCTPTGSKLLDFRLDFNEIGDDGARYFAEVLDPFHASSSVCRGDVDVDTPSLKSLHLRGNKIGFEGSMALANHLRHNGEVTVVSLQGNRDIPEGLLNRIEEACKQNNVPLSKRKSIGEKRLSVIRSSQQPSSFNEEQKEREERGSLTNTCMNLDETIVALENNNQRPHLQDIRIFDEELSPTKLTRLCYALTHYHQNDGIKKSSPIKTLWQKNNSIGDNGSTLLSITLAKLTSLQELYITKNNISDFGASQLANALKEPTCKLQELWLSNNNISDEGATALAAALKVNKHLKELRLNQNQIGNAGAGQLGYVLSLGSNSALEVLSLKGNLIGDAGGHSFLAGIAMERSSFSVHLQNNDISKEMENQLKMMSHWGHDADEVAV